jgi:hypothetical protein
MSFEVLIVIYDGNTLAERSKRTKKFHAKAQRRKEGIQEASSTQTPLAFFLCAFAPLRENCL